VARTVSVTGTLAAEDAVLLGTKVVGRLSQITVDLGSRVRRGQAIARIDPGDYRLRVEQAEATLQQARARLGLPPDGTSDRIDPANTGAVRQATAVLKEARLNRQRQVSLRAQIAPGFALADRLEALNQAVRVMNLPAGYTTSVSGRGRELARTFNEFL
jgi:HAE1 family hydrophobic/amphiphilic exporter-1